MVKAADEGPNLSTVESEGLMPTAAAVSNRSALKAISITASAAFLVLVFRLARTKVIAVVLGPAGVGLLGALSTLLATVLTVADLGMRGSAVRQIAVAAGTNDARRAARVVWTMRRAVLVLGSIGAAVVWLLAGWLSEVSLGTTMYATAVAVLSLAVLFTSVNNGQRALLRGMRRVSDLAKSDIWAALWGSIATVLVIWMWRIDGVAPSIAAGALVSVIVTWYYARRVTMPRVRPTLSEFRHELKGLADLGIVLLVVGVASTAAQFAIRAILVRTQGLEVAGQFQAAATLSIVYVGFVMQAMGQDFFPRLTAVSGDNEMVNRLTNQQVELSMHLAGAGVVATTVLSDVLVGLLYSADFVVAGEILRWQCMGVIVQLVSTPVAYILMARGESRAILVTELLASALQVAIFWFLYDRFGVVGAAFALAAANSIHLLLLQLNARHLTGYRVSAGVMRSTISTGAGYAAAMLASLLLSRPHAILTGLAIAAAIAIYGYRSLSRMTEAPLAQRLMSLIGRRIGR